MRRIRLVTAGTVVAAASLLSPSGPADAAPKRPEVYSVIEGKDSQSGRAALVVLGEMLVPYRSLRLLNGMGNDVGTPQARGHGRTMLVLLLPEGLPAGSYTLEILPKKGVVVSVKVLVSYGIPADGSVADGQLSTELRADLDDAATLDGRPADFYRDASNLNAGTLSTDLFSAIVDLAAEGAIGTGPNQVAAGNHTHAGQYLEPSTLSSVGTINATTNPVHWTQLKGVPAGLADGADDAASYTAGAGLRLSGIQFSVDFAGTGGAPTVARSDHDHDATYPRKIELDAGGTVNHASNPVAWTRLKGVPAGFADGVDDHTTYTAGTGLALAGSQFSLSYGGTGAATSVARSDHDHDAWYWRKGDLDTGGTINATSNPVVWSRLKGVPAGFADGVDDDTTYTAGSGLALTGTQFSVNWGGTGSSATCARGDHHHDAVYAPLTHDHDILYYRKSFLDTGGTVNDNANPVVWTRLKGVPSGFADGVDDDTVYSAGSGLTLNAGQFAASFAGTGTATTVARSDHHHDASYPSRSELDTGGTINDPSNPVTWTKLKGVPAGIADGVDDDTTYTAGTGLKLTGTQFSVDFAGTGTAGTAARSDHTHSGIWVQKTGDSMTGALTVTTSKSPAVDIDASSGAYQSTALRIRGPENGSGISAEGGIGVYASGVLHGVYGTCFSASGAGVEGTTQSSAGSYGVLGRCQSTTGTAGVYAECTANGPSALVANHTGSTGNIAEFRANGVTVASVDHGGVGRFKGLYSDVSGTATAIRGDNVGEGSKGIGVEGVATAAAGSGVNAGVGVKGTGWTAGVQGIGIYDGYGPSNYGIYGEGGDAGVYGVPTGNSYGVWGDTRSNSGAIGVYGRCLNIGGVAGVVAECVADGPAALMTNHTGGSGNQAIFRLNGGNVARIDRGGKGYFNGGTQSSGADFAESVAVDRAKSSFEPGDVIVVDTESDRRFSLSTEKESTLVAGVYSTKPALLGTTHDVAGDGEKLRDEIPLGIVGIVPTKVCDEGGPVRRGDLLVTSSVPGHAMRAPAKPRPGTVLGKALGRLDEGRGTVEVLVTLR